MQNFDAHPYTYLKVDAIDARTHTATLHIMHRPASPRPRVPELVAHLFGGIEVDGGGFVILPGGHIKPVPPRGPVTDLVALAANLAEHKLVGDIALGLAQRRSMIRSIVALCEHLYKENDVVSKSPQRLDKARPNER